MKHDNSEGAPCSHMEPMLQDIADGTGKGWRRLYALAHAARCERCARFLQRTEQTIACLRGAKEPMPDDVLARLKSKIDD